MLVRRIAAGACALSFIIPAGALAVPIQDPVAPKHQPAVVSHGDTKYDLQNQQDVSAGDRVGSLSAKQLLAGYGATKPATPATPAFASHDDSNGWEIAAWAEGAVLAALAVGCVVLISGRTRSRRLSS
jgi:hypothetical protein